MSLSQRSPVRPAEVGGGEAAPASPAGNRARRSRWRDLRLWCGILLVLASVVVGAKVLAAADDTVGVWTLDHDASAGMSLTVSDLHATRLHFASAAEQGHYWLAGERLPVGAHLTRDVGGGELLARAAVTTDSAAAVRQLPLGVTAAGLPSDVAPGDHVEVWAMPKPDAARSRSELVLSDAAVLSVGDTSLSGLGSDRQVVVALPGAADTGSILDRLNGATVVLVRIGG